MSYYFYIFNFRIQLMPVVQPQELMNNIRTKYFMKHQIDVVISSGADVQKDMNVV